MTDCRLGTYTEATVELGFGERRSMILDIGVPRA